MLRVCRYLKPALLDSSNAVDPHEASYAILRTMDMLNVVQFIPDPRAAIILVIVPEHPFYLNEQLLVIDPLLTLGSLFKRVISAP